MATLNIFDQKVQLVLSHRLDSLKDTHQAHWGKMNSAQMLAHLNVMFELGLKDNLPSPNRFVKFMLKTLVKEKIVNENPYKKNSRTAPEMVIKHQPNFESERVKVQNYLADIVNKGSSFFENRAHPAFGQLTAKQWSNLFYKHIDHHFTQFGI